ncbi:MAG: FGGY-family carbohydrate kinase [Acidimicrobiales bacterium]
MTILVLDIGTSGVRAAIVGADATILRERSGEFLPDTPFDGLVEFDAVAYADLAIDLARRVLADNGEAGGEPVAAIGISNQRASTIVWDRATGEPVAPAQSWQDLRTIGDCLVLQAEGLFIAPNQPATKAANIWNGVDPDRERDLCVGTPDTWLVWRLTEGAEHITDASNAAISGMTTSGGREWDERILGLLNLPAASLPRIVDSSGRLATATVFGRDIPICGIAGDQQASLIGQGAVQPGLAKITFGTGGMLDVCLGPDRPLEASRSTGGTFPIVCWQRDGEQMWGLEAIMLSCGTNVQWLRDDLGIISSAADSETVAGACETTDGVMYVPAQLGLGTPHWDYGARGTLLGLTRGSNRSHITRAVLEGVAHRGADLVEAAEADAGIRIERLRVDGGMTDNAVFVQALADICGRPVEVSPVRDATAVGAALLAGLEIGMWDSWADIAATWRPTSVVEPRADVDRDAQRAQWARAVERAKGWYPELSALDF